MQNRYTGDIGDYVKYGLLRTLSGDQRLGVAWYLFPNEGHNDDGKHVSYLNDPDKWRNRDPNLFDVLKRIVSDSQRNVSAIERNVSAIEGSGILGNAIFARDILTAPNLAPAERKDWRQQWFKDVCASLTDCEIIFADPDNGLCEDEKFRPGRVKNWKRLPLQEAKTLAKGRTAIIYHHNTRRKGGHEEEIRYWISLLGQNTLALRWRGYSSRTFFILNSTSGTKDKLRAFSLHLGPKAELYGLPNKA